MLHLYEIQISVSANKVLLEQSQVHFVYILSTTAFEWGSRVE